MFSKLDKIEERYDELNDSICKIDPVTQLDLYKSTSKELKDISEIVEKYREYKSNQKEIDEYKTFFSDPSLNESAKEEVHKLEEKNKIILDDLKTMLSPKDADDDKNVIIEIRAGTGGTEASLFASTLFKMYSMFALKKKWKIEILGSNETELGGFKEVSFMISGKGAYSELKFESGVHRVQRVPETESQGRIHTSTATVAVLPEAEDVEVNIDPSELQIDTFRAGGAGGQHVNKTESAIRITHLPSGIVVECQDERSQHKNKDKAMKVLRSRILKIKKEESEKALSEERRSQVGTGDRSERIRTYNFPQNRVTDHRTGKSSHQLEEFLGGNIDLVK